MNETAHPAARAAFDRILVGAHAGGRLAAPEGAPPHRGRARGPGARGRPGVPRVPSKPREQVRVAHGQPLGRRARHRGRRQRQHQRDGRRAGERAAPARSERGAGIARDRIRAQSAQAWEVEAGLLYDDLAWFLYDELWDISSTARPELSPSERGDQIDLVLDPLLDTAVPDGDRAALVAVNVFRAVLAARMVTVLGALTHDEGPAAGD